MHRLTLGKILTHSEPPGYRQTQARAKPKLGAYVARIGVKRSSVRRLRRTLAAMWSPTNSITTPTASDARLWPR